MTPSPELGQPKAPDKVCDEQRAAATATISDDRDNIEPTTERSTDVQHTTTAASSDITSGSSTLATSTDVTAAAVIATSVDATVSTPSRTTNIAANSSSSSKMPTTNVVGGATVGVVPSVISTMAMSAAATTTTTTTAASAVKVSSSQSSTTATATAAPAGGQNGKNSSSANTGNNSTSSSNSNSNSNSNTSKDHLPESPSSDQEPVLVAMPEDTLQDLLEEAYTYKCPKDREHKSAIFNELLNKAEREDQEQNFSFTSRPVHSKRSSGGRPTQGGSLQDLPEATKQEYGYSSSEYYAVSSYSSRRSGGGGYGGANAGMGIEGVGGSGGGGSSHGAGSRSKRQISSVSSRQREGGSLPSNVNQTISEQPFLKEVRRPLKSTSIKSSSSSKSNDYGALLQSAPLNAITGSDCSWSTSGGAIIAGEESHLLAGAGSGELCGATSMINDHRTVPAHTVINMHDLGVDEPSTSTSVSVIGHNPLQQNNHYENSGTDDIELIAGGVGGTACGNSSTNTAITGSSSPNVCSMAASAAIASAAVALGTGAAGPSTTLGYCGSGTAAATSGGDLYSSNGTGGLGGINSGGTSSSSAAATNSTSSSNNNSSVGLSATKKTFSYPTQQYTAEACLDIGQTCRGTRPLSVHHVDKTVSLPMLEAVQLGSSYPSVKCMIDSSKSGDQTAMKTMLSPQPLSNQFISTTRSSMQYPSIQQKFDENANSVSQFGGGSGGIGSSTSGGSIGGGGNSTGTSSSGGKKYRKPKSDRNTVVVVPENIVGYRGQSDIEALVKYIENDGKAKQSQQHQASISNGGSDVSGVAAAAGENGNGSGGTTSSSNGTVTSGTTASTSGGVDADKPKRKNEKKRDRTAGGAKQLKKSNSLEELSSCSRKKVEEENTRQNHVEKARAQETDPAVTLRSSKSQKKKEQQQSTGGTKEGNAGCSNSKQQQRTERRSWGTEELNFFGSQSVEAQSPSDEPPQSIAPASSNSASGKVGKKDKKEAKDHHNPSSSSSVVDPASAQQHSTTRKRDSSLSSLGGGTQGGGGSNGGEGSDFHVVTKKKKAKKKLPNAAGTGAGHDDVASGSNFIGGAANRRQHSHGSSGGNGGYGRASSGSTFPANNSSTGGGRYHASNHFITDREVYMSNDVSRRKSTSSVPPSEKSDSSDADSVYSLPIEANSSRKHHRQQQQSQQQQQQQKPSKKQQLPNNTSHQQRQQQQSGGSASATATPQSYAEIARIPNMTTYEKSGMDIGSGGGGTTASAGTGGSGWPTVAEGSSQSKDGGSAGSSNVLQDLNSSEAFPQLVESHQYQAPPPSHYLSNQHQQPLLSSQPLLALPSAVSANNPSNSGTTVPYQAQIVAPRATYSQSLLTAVVSTNGTGEEPLIISTSASGKTTGSATGAIINTVVSTATNEIHNGPVTTNNASEGGIGGATKASLHKSKSVDNNEIYYSNEHYPALERTIKGYGQTTLPSGLSCNKATNAKGTSAATSVPIAGLSFGQVAAAAPPAPLASGTAASPPATTPSVTNSTSATVTVNSAPQSQPVNTVAAKKGKAKKETTVTIVPTEGTDTSVAFAGTIATVQSSVAGNTSSNNMPNDSDTQSPTILPFDTRRAMNDAEPPAGLSSIQFMQAPQQQQSSEKLLAQQQQHVLQGGGKRNKKDKQSNITAASGASSGAGKGSSGRSSTSTASNSASNHLQPNRPAVIMMNDGVEQKSNEFTFGFSNDYELLFGDFSEEDCRKLLEGSTADSSAATSSSQKPKGQKPNSRVSCVPVTSCNIDGSDREPSLSPSSSSAVMNETRNSSSTSSTSCNSLGKPPLQQSSSSPSSSSSVCSSSSSSSNAPSYQKLPLLPSLVATPPQLYLGAHGNIVPAADSAAIETTVATVVSSTTVMPPLLTDPGTATNLFAHPPPAVLHPIYTQPPPSLPALSRHNQFALPPPAVVAATAAVSSGVQPIPVVAAVPPGSASTTVAVVNAVPPPPAATVQVVKEGLLPGAPPTPTLVAVPSAAHLMVPPPALPPMATAVLLPSQAVVVPVVPTGSAASIADVANNNVLVATVPSSSLPHHHQQTVMTTRPQAATVGGGLQNHNNNVATNSVTQTYHASQQQQQQLQLQQTTAEVTNSAATITPVSPTSQMVTTVEASAQTINSNNAAGIQEPKGGTTVAPVTSGASATPIPVRLDKKKELNLRFVEPEQVHSIDYNHDKIVFFVGTAWEDAICGSNGTAKYYEGQ